jgi:succinoglycan biosynthesis transport protein ExoP
LRLAPVRPLAAPPPPAAEVRATLRFDLGSLLAALRRNLVPIAAILATSLVAGLVLTLLVTPRYVVSASIQIDQAADRVLESAEVRPTADDGDAERLLQTQTDVLRSRSLAIRVAQRLKLFGNPGFFAAMEASPPGDSTVIGRARDREATLQLLQSHLAVDLPRNSRVATITFESTDPAVAARIANTYASEFIQANLQRKFDSSAYARDFVSRQLAATKDRLEVSERALNDYARAAGLIRTGDSGGEKGGGSASVTTASLVQLNTAANDARAARIAAEQKWRAASTAPLMSIADVLGNQAVERLLEQRAAGAAELQRERARHLGGHPSVRQLEYQQAELDRQVSDIASAIRSSIRDQYREASGREHALAGQVNALKGATLAEQDRSVRYTILAREADTNRTLYDGLLQRYKELSAARGDQREQPLDRRSRRAAARPLLPAASAQPHGGARRGAGGRRRHRAGPRTARRCGAGA